MPDYASLYQTYMVVCWPVFLICGVVGFITQDRGVIRCALVAGVGQIAADAWFSFGPGFQNGEQPWGMFVILYLVSCVVTTMRPTTRLCSLCGGLFLGGVAFSLIRGISGPDQDVIFWTNNLLLGWAILLVLIGGAFFDMGKAIAGRIGRALTRLAGTQSSDGMA